MAKLAESKIKFTFVTVGEKAYIATHKKVNKEKKREKISQKRNKKTNKTSKSP